MCNETKESVALRNWEEACQRLEEAEARLVQWTLGHLEPPPAEIREAVARAQATADALYEQVVRAMAGHGAG